MFKINKITIFFFLLSLAFLVIIYADNSENWDKEEYAALEKKMIQAQNKNHDECITLASFLIRKFPDKEIPYITISNIYVLQNKFDEAERTLKDGIKNVKENTPLYLKLAHFYKRTSPEKLDKLIDSFKKDEAKRSDYSSVLAKLYVIADKKDEAQKIFSSDIKDGKQNYYSLKSSFDFLKKENKYNEACGLIKNNISSPNLKSDEKINLYESLLSLIESKDDKIISEISVILKDLINELNDYEKAKSLIQKTIQISSLNGYHEKFADYYKNNKDSNNDLWIYAQTLSEIGETQKSSDMKRNYNGNNLWMLEEKSRNLFLTGSENDTKLSLETWQKICKLAPNNLRYQVTYSQFLNLSGNKKDSLNELTKIKPDSLDEQLQILYFALLFDNLSALKKYTDIINAWEQASAFFKFDHLNVYKNAIFKNLPQTEDHKELLNVLNKKIESEKSPLPEMILFKAFLAEELRDFDLYFSSMEKYLNLLKQFNADLTYDFVKRALSKGMKRNEDKNGSVKYTVEDKKFLEAGEKWLNILIEKNPQIPDFYADLSNIYKAYGKEDKALEKIKSLAKGKENNAEYQHLIAYCLMKAEHPEMALPYFEKSISLAPDVMQYKVNFAGSLIRTKQFQKAIDIYSEVMTSEYTAETWNIDFLLEQVCYCYNQMNKGKEFIDFINKFKTNNRVPQEKFYLSAVTILLSKGYKKEAIDLCDEFASKYPKSTMVYDAYFKFAGFYIAEKEYEKAKMLFKKIADIFKDDKIKMIDSLYNVGEMERRLGNYSESVKLWKELAEKFPNDDAAQNALYSAGYLAENDMKDKKLAIELYEKYLNIKPVNAETVKIVTEKLKNLKENK